MTTFLEILLILFFIFVNHFGYASSLTTTLPSETEFSCINLHPDEESWLVIILLSSLAILLATVGVVGNTFSLLVLLSSTNKQSVDIYLVCLAAFDGIYGLCFAVFFAIEKLTPLEARGSLVHVLTRLITRPLVDLSSNLGIVAICLFALERLFAVYRPFSPLNKRYLAIAVAAATVLTLPDFFESTISPTTHSNPANYCYTRSWFGRQRPLYNPIYITFYMVVFTYIPLTLLIVFNGFLIYGVAGISQNHKNLKSQQLSKSADIFNPNNTHVREQKRLTFMLIAIICVFTVCQLPITALHLYSAFSPSKQSLGIVVEISNLLVLGSSTTNLLFYSVFNRRFRKSAVQFLNRFKQEDSQQSNMASENMVLQPMCKKNISPQCVKNPISNEEQMLSNNDDVIVDTV